MQTGWVCSPTNVWTYGADGETHSVGYDANGNKLSVTDHWAESRRWGYDNRNRATRVTDPLNQSTSTAYDVANNKTQVTLWARITTPSRPANPSTLAPAPT